MRKIILWAAAVGWLVVCLFLSWQTGEETVGLSLKIAQWVCSFLSGMGFMVELESLHMHLRLFAHFGIFFAEGILAGGAAAVSFPKRKKLALPLTSLAISCLAVLAEVGKLPVPGRHLTWSEAALNVLGAVLGVLLIAVVSVCVKARSKK